MSFLSKFIIIAARIFIIVIFLIVIAIFIAPLLFRSAKLETLQKDSAKLNEAIQKLSPPPAQTVDARQYMVGPNNRRIYIGMSKNEVISEWGWPSRNGIFKSTGKWGMHEQWKYVYLTPDNKYRKYVYLYIDNDVLTSWQELTE